MFAQVGLDFRSHTQQRALRGYNCKGLAKTSPSGEVNAVKLIVSAVILRSTRIPSKIVRFRAFFEENSITDSRATKPSNALVFSGFADLAQSFLTPLGGREEGHRKWLRSKFLPPMAPT